MLYLLQFKVGDKYYLLHDGESVFIGGENIEDAREGYRDNIAKAISISGFDIVKFESSEELLNAIGGKIPYHIINIKGGLIPFYGVEILKKKEDEDGLPYLMTTPETVRKIRLSRKGFHPLILRLKSDGQWECLSHTFNNGDEKWFKYDTKTVEEFLNNLSKYSMLMEELL